MSRGQRDIRSEQGTAMIEFALVLPILLILVLGIVDFGRALNYWNDTNHIAASAARYAAVNKNPGADHAMPVDFFTYIRGQAETEELASGTLVDGSDSPSTRGQEMRVCIELLGTGTDAQKRAVGSPIKVRLTQTFHLIPFLGQRLDGPAIELTGEAVMRLEQPYTLPPVTGSVACDPA